MITHIQKNVTIEMDKNENIKKIVFLPDGMFFQIYWADGTISEYKYEYYKSSKEAKK